jgi:hypothetical protein
MLIPYTAIASRYSEIDPVDDQNSAVDIIATSWRLVGE